MTSRLLIGCVALSIFALGCSDPIIGKWEGGKSAQRDNEMDYDDELRGEGEIHFSSGGTSYCATFDIEVRSDDGDKYDIDWECSGDCQGNSVACANLDFRMDCTMSGDDDVMDCDGDEAWDTYDFEWEKVSD